MRPTFWFYGLSGSGKTSAASVACALFGGPSLDSSTVRQHIAPFVGYSALERLKIAKTMAILSREIALDEETYPGPAVFISCMAPFEECRRAAIALNPGIRFVLVETSLDVCKDRRANSGAYGSDDQVLRVDLLPEPFLKISGEEPSLIWLEQLGKCLGTSPGTHPQSSSSS